MNRTLIIGDIHGRYNEMMKALEYMGYKDSDRLIFLGDYIDRGPDSKKVMDFLVELRKNRDNIFLKGNHEDIFLKLSLGNATFWSTWLEDGEGRNCLRSYGINPDTFQKRGENYFYVDGDRKIPMGSGVQTAMFFSGNFPKEHLEFMRDAKASHELGDFFFSHAGAQRDMELSRQPEWALVWGDDKFGYNETDYGRIMVYGHYHRKSPMVGFKKIGIAIDGKVAAFDLKDMVIVDSDGTFTEVRPDALIGNLYADYMHPLWRGDK